MRRIGNPRIVLWILIVALLAYVAYLYKNGESSNPSTPQTRPAVSLATVVSDFRELKNIQVPTEAELGGHFYATELLFPAEFKGEVGDVFYVRLEDGHIMATISYRIEELTEDVPVKASYTPLKEHGANYIPEGEYTVKSIEEQGIEGINNE